MSAAFPEFLYLVVLAIIFGFFMAFGIGANDVANSFGSSVSAGSLSLGWAVILGSICELAGALALGASVAGTIRGKVVDGSFYEDEPEIFMLGSTTALIAASTWLFVATYFQFPVSTTHDIVGAMIGFSLAAYGFESIVWKETSKIFISWVAAPLFAGTIAFIFFFLLKRLVLNSAHVFERGIKTFPVVVWVALTVNLFFIMSKAKTNKHINLTTTEWNQKVVLPVSVGGGILSALITYFFICPHLRKRVEIEHALVEEELKAEAEAEEVGYAKGEEEAEYDEDGKIDKGEAMAEGPLDEKKNGEDTIRDDPDKVDKEDDLKKSKHVILRGLDWVAENTIRQDLKAQSLAENHRAAHLWDTSAEYDGKVEHLFSFLQVFTACLASFAHGSNDVANAIAPMSAVIDIYNTGVFNSKAPVQRWLLAIGGVGIALGFAIFGYRIIKAVGYKLIVISPSRGFCIELAASLSVSLASFLSIPVSTTQCLVGATCGVGLASGGVKSVNGFWLLRVAFGWVTIFFCAVLVNAGFFAFTAYSPSLL